MFLNPAFIDGYEMCDSSDGTAQRRVLQLSQAVGETDTEYSLVKGAHSESTLRDKGRCRMLWALACLATVLAIVAVAVAALGGKNSSGNSDSGSTLVAAATQRMEETIVALERRLNQTQATTVELLAENVRLWEKNRELETSLLNVQLVAGPSGSAGPTGPAGPVGRAGPSGPSGPRGFPGTGTATCV